MSILWCLGHLGCRIWSRRQGVRFSRQCRRATANLGVSIALSSNESIETNFGTPDVELWVLLLGDLLTQSLYKIFMSSGSNCSTLGALKKKKGEERHTRCGIVERNSAFGIQVGPMQAFVKDKVHDGAMLLLQPCIVLMIPPKIGRYSHETIKLIILFQRESKPGKRHISRTHDLLHFWPRETLILFVDSTQEFLIPFIKIEKKFGTFGGPLVPR